MKNIFKKFLLLSIINTSTIKTLTRIEITTKTLGFSKSDVLLRKKSVFAKLVSRQPYTIEGNKELKRISYELKLNFNRTSNLLIKNHLLKTKKINPKINPIKFNDFVLDVFEEVYGKYGPGHFADVPHAIKFKFKKIKEIILTNQRLIFVFGVNKNSYYFTKYKLIKMGKIISINDTAGKKPTIYLYSKQNIKLFKDSLKIK